MRRRSLEVSAAPIQSQDLMPRLPKNAPRLPKGSSDFAKWRKRYAVTIQEAAEFFAVEPQAVDHWDKHGAPALVMRLIALIGRRDLSAFHPAWKGWTISHTGKMHGPGGLWFNAKALAVLPRCVADLEDFKNSIERQERHRARVRTELLNSAVTNAFDGWFAPES